MLVHLLMHSLICLLASPLIRQSLQVQSELTMCRRGAGGWALLWSVVIHPFPSPYQSHPFVDLLLACMIEWRSGDTSWIVVMCMCQVLNLAAEVRYKAHQAPLLFHF